MKKDTGKKIQLTLRFLKGSKRFFIVSMFFSAAAALADMVIPQIVRYSVDSVMGGKPSALPHFITEAVEKIGGTGYLKTHFWVIARVLVATAVFRAVSQYTACVSNAKGTETLSKTTRDTLFSHITRLPYSWYSRNRTGDIIQRCTSDISTVNEFLSNEMISLFRVALLLILSLFFMLGMHTGLTFIALGTFPLIILNSVFFDRKIEKNFRAYDEGEGRLSAEVQENLTGVRVIRAFGQEARELERLKKQNAGITEKGKKIGSTFGTFFCISDILSMIQVMIVIVSGAFFCMRGSMEPGEYIAFISYNTMLSWPLDELGRMITELGKANVSAERILDIMEEPEEEKSEKGLKPDMDKDIEFSHVSFSYSEKAPVLRDVSFKIKAGTTLGILGGTGSGKSTLVLLLDKILLPDRDGGRITVGGTDIRDIDTGHLRKNIGMVLQDPYLFSRTVAENIGIADDSLSDDDIRKAADAACLTETVQSFARGFDTPCGERGVTLSGGQKQRVAIARILTRNTPVMIFDDSMSALDTETDARIRASLEKRFGKSTVILISHRISTLSKADRIIVLDVGTVAEEGTHGELIAKNGMYRAIYDIQTSGRGELQ